MKKVSWFPGALFLLVVLGIPLRTQAVSPSPIPEELAEKAAKGIRVKGDTVCLFQSGTGDVKRAISPGDLLTVYREEGQHGLTEVGKIRVRAYRGEDYLGGDVVEGEVQTGDIAKKGAAASLVISPGDKCDERH